MVVEAIEKIGYYMKPDEWLGCPHLTFRDGRHWCDMVLREEFPGIKDSLSIGAGCSSGLNSWRHEPVVDRRKRENPRGGR
jgi:hypothetical protein